MFKVKDAVTVLDTWAAARDSTSIFTKKHIDIKPNSSGREQIHAHMEKCGKHLIQLNYRNFMTAVKVFFAMTNLNRKK